MNPEIYRLLEAVLKFVIVSGYDIKVGIRNPEDLVEVVKPISAQVSLFP